MQGIFGKQDLGLGATVRQPVVEEVRASGERVLWESHRSSARRRHPDSHDRHGLARYELFTSWFLAVFSAFLGVLARLTAITASGVLEPALLGTAAFVCLVGGGWAAVWSYRAREAVRRDSLLRSYILSTERLVVVGTDAFVEVLLSEVCSVRLKWHRDGTGSVVCVYAGEVNKKTIAIEGIEDAAEVKRILEDCRAAIAGRELRESLEDNSSAEEAAQR
ncbi:MAG: hypothetical protein L0G70_07975 [Rubrobacter sp.]|nr:hypothetical protein [Rubrobacter sp.]